VLPVSVQGMTGLTPYARFGDKTALALMDGSGRVLPFDPTRAPADLGTTPLISLEPTSRAWLHERIAQRFDAMLAEGLVGEVQALRARGDLHAGLPSMRCVGYRQAWEALDAGNPGPLRERGIAATRQLAKRQLTWLRGMPQRHVVACDGTEPAAAVVALARRFAAR